MLLKQVVEWSCGKCHSLDLDFLAGQTPSEEYHKLEIILIVSHCVVPYI